MDSRLTTVVMITVLSSCLLSSVHAINCYVCSSAGQLNAGGFDPDCASSDTSLYQDHRRECLTGVNVCQASKWTTDDGTPMTNRFCGPVSQFPGTVVPDECILRDDRTIGCVCGSDYCNGGAISLTKFSTTPNSANPNSGSLLTNQSALALMGLLAVAVTRVL